MRSLTSLSLVLAAALAACAPTSPAPEPAAERSTTLRLVDDRAVTEPGEHYVAVSFSPDGRQLALAPGGFGAIDVVPADGDGHQVRRLVEADRCGYRFAWEPDGRSIVYREGTDRLARVDLAGAVTPLAAPGATVGFPAISARGEILYTSEGRVRAATAGARLAADLEQPGLVLVSAARASRIAGWDGTHIFTADPATGRRVELFEGPGFFDVELSADGRLALARESRGRFGHVWVADAEGRWRRDLGVGWGAHLAPDASSIVYVLQENDGLRFLEADLWIMAVDGSRRTRLTETPDILEIEPAFAPDGERLAYVDAATGQVHTARLTAEEVLP